MGNGYYGIQTGAAFMSGMAQAYNRGLMLQADSKRFALQKTQIDRSYDLQRGRFDLAKTDSRRRIIGDMTGIDQQIRTAENNARLGMGSAGTVQTLIGRRDELDSLSGDINTRTLAPRIGRSSASTEQENKFQKEYSRVSSQLGLNPDPDDPKHFYDYRGLFKETGGLSVDESNHFPSKFKLDGHPKLIIKGINTKTGKTSAPTIGGQRYTPVTLDDGTEGVFDKKTGKNRKLNYSASTGAYTLGDVVKPTTIADKEISRTISDVQDVVGEAQGQITKAINEIPKGTLQAGGGAMASALRDIVDSGESERLAELDPEGYLERIKRGGLDIGPEATVDPIYDDAIMKTVNESIRASDLIPADKLEAAIQAERLAVNPSIERIIPIAVDMVKPDLSNKLGSLLSFATTYPAYAVTGALDIASIGLEKLGVKNRPRERFSGKLTRSNLNIFSPEDRSKRAAEVSSVVQRTTDQVFDVLFKKFLPYKDQYLASIGISPDSPDADAYFEGLVKMNITDDIQKKVDRALKTELDDITGDNIVTAAFKKGRKDAAGKPAVIVPAVKRYLKFLSKNPPSKNIKF